MTSAAIKAVVDGMGWDLDAAEAADMLKLATKAWEAGQAEISPERDEWRDMAEGSGAEAYSHCCDNLDAWQRRTDPELRGPEGTLCGWMDWAMAAITERDLRGHLEELVQLLAVVQLLARTLDLDTSACAIKQGIGDGKWQTHTLDEVIDRASKLLGIDQPKTEAMDSSAVVH